MSPRRPVQADYHDPTAGIGGSAPAYSALTLRLVLAAFGLLVSAIGTGICVRLEVWPMVAFFAVIFCITVVDLMVITRRRLHGDRPRAATVRPPRPR